jgi:hypothetical protein
MSKFYDEPLSFDKSRFSSEVGRILVWAISLCYNTIAILLLPKTQQYQPPNYKYIKN